MKNINYSLRSINTVDVAQIVSHRQHMFYDMGTTDQAVLKRMGEDYTYWLREKLEKAEYLGWFVQDEAGEVVAGLGLWLIDWPPHIYSKGTRGYIMDVYTEPAHRQRGLARALLEEAIGYCQTHKIEMLTLHASDAGRSLYENFGFEKTNEMRLILKQS